jgi:ribokinase
MRIATRGCTATTVCLCFVSEQGESAIVWHVDDDVAVTSETVLAAEAAFEGVDAVLMTFEMPVAAVREAISLGRDHGAQVFVQPAPRLANPADADSIPWDQLDVLVPNENEARALLQGDRDLREEDLAGALFRGLAVPNVVVTPRRVGMRRPFRWHDCSVPSPEDRSGRHKRRR